MTADEHLPRGDQMLTVVAVRNLDATVFSAVVVGQEGDRFTLRVEDSARLASPAVGEGHRVKLMYGSGAMVMRLAGRIDSVGADHIVVQADGAPLPGERREYIRAEMVLTISAKILSATEVDAARAEANARTLAEDDWSVQLVDLSGSGMKLRLVEPCAPGQLIDIRVRVEDHIAGPVALLGRVVRVLPVETGEGKDIALQFEDLSLADQDVLISLAFKVRYEQLGA